jgi:hypothetical protein
MTTLTIDGYDIAIQRTGAFASATFSEEADEACGHTRPDWSDCTPREVERYRSIQRALKSYAREHELDGVDLYANDGTFCGTVWA